MNYKPAIIFIYIDTLSTLQAMTKETNHFIAEQIVNSSL